MPFQNAVLEAPERGSAKFPSFSPRLQFKEVDKGDRTRMKVGKGDARLMEG